MDGYPKDIVLRETKELKEETIRTTLYRLRKKGLADNDGLVWGITASGRKYLKKLLGNKNYIHDKKFNSKLARNMIVAFDIPEKLRFKRDLLRGGLKSLGFAMLQQSVWFGPAPLPKEFIKWMRELDVINYIKFFKAAEHDIV